MPKFVTNPQTKMLGSVVKSVLDSVQYENYKHIVDPVFEKNGIKSIDPEKHYSAQVLLDMYKSMTEQPGAMFDFVAIGKNVAQNIDFGSDVQTISEAIHALNGLYQIMLINFDVSEEYEIEVISDNHLRVRDNNPYPHDMVFGYLHTLSNRFRLEGTYPTIKREYDVPDNPDDGGAIYDITW